MKSCPLFLSIIFQAMDTTSATALLARASQRATIYTAIERAKVVQVLEIQGCGESAGPLFREVNLY